VKGVNDAPIIVNKEELEKKLTTEEDTEKSVSLLEHGKDAWGEDKAERLLWQIMEGADFGFGKVEIEKENIIKVSPNEKKINSLCKEKKFDGSFTFKIKVVDSKGAQSPKEDVSGIINPVNDAPIIKELPVPILETKEDTEADKLPSILLKRYAEDVDNKIDKLLFFFKDKEGNPTDTLELEGLCTLRIEGENASTQKLLLNSLVKDTWTEDARFTLYLEDPVSETKKEASLKIEPVNDPPTLSDPSVFPEKGGSDKEYTYSVRYSDIDGHTPKFVKLFIQITPIPWGDIIIPVIKEKEFDMKEEEEGLYKAKVKFEAKEVGADHMLSFYIKAEDEEGGPAQTLTLSGPIVNDAPAARIILAKEVYKIGEIVVVRCEAFDLNNDALTYSGFLEIDGLLYPLPIDEEPPIIIYGESIISEFELKPEIEGEYTISLFVSDKLQMTPATPITFFVGEEGEGVLTIKTVPEAVVLVKRGRKVLYKGTADIEGKVDIIGIEEGEYEVFVKKAGYKGEQKRVEIKALVHTSDLIQLTQPDVLFTLVCSATKLSVKIREGAGVDALEYSWDDNTWMSAEKVEEDFIIPAPWLDKIYLRAIKDGKVIKESHFSLLPEKERGKKGERFVYLLDRRDENTIYVKEGVKLLIAPDVLLNKEDECTLYLDILQRILPRLCSAIYRVKIKDVSIAEGERIMLQMPYKEVKSTPVVWELDERMNPLRRLKKEEVLINTEERMVTVFIKELSSRLYAVFEANPVGDIEGVVKQKDGRVIEDVDVFLYLEDGSVADSVKTDKNGAFSFEGKFVDSTYTIFVRKEGYAEERRVFELLPEGEWLEFVLVAETLYVYNFPNPFNTKETEYTTIKLWLPKDAEEVVIRLLDAATCSIREWRLGPLSGGTHKIEWRGRNDAGKNVASGVYILVLEAHYVDGGLERAFNKILLLRK
jgi:hypothetical protein